LADVIVELSSLSVKFMELHACDADEKAITFRNSRETLMSIVKLALIAAFAFTASISVGSVVTSSSAEAKAHVTKGSPGKCGVGKFFSKKDKGCIAK
jgi:uncharacterized low-complexity protein